jgi:hypothetical protein
MSLLYTDALDLKEAEFPLILCGDKNCPYNDGGEAKCHLPTLEELMEACGDGFDLLVNTTSPQINWEAGVFEWKDGLSLYLDESKPIGIGLSPIQAVKNLYCALHQKKI